MIKNLLFDFGGVFLNLDKTATQNKLKKYFPDGIPIDIQELHHQYEKGEINTKKFIDFHLDRVQGHERHDFIEIWNSMLGDLPEHRLQFLKELKSLEKYRIFLLSNTNDLHVNWVNKNISEFDEFLSCFEQFYLSFQIGYRKPNADIFEFVIHQNHIKPEETLFIDDTKEHTQTAKQLGFEIWHLDEKKQDVTDLYDVKKSVL